MRPLIVQFRLFFFNATATTEIYTLSLHDALPIWRGRFRLVGESPPIRQIYAVIEKVASTRSEEHTSELQSRVELVCRLLLEKKKHPHRKANDASPLHQG